MSQLINYFETPELSEFYFEDSYVLTIEETPTLLSFEIDAVLTEKHHEYTSPHKGEQHCYKKTLLSFLDAEAHEWSSKKFIAFSDNSGEFDYGNIDLFTTDNDNYLLSGDWGQVTIRGGTQKITPLSNSTI
ncbi:hypothetical protein PS903_03834 [Pseudomonas fluorescens]|nr:hypothetical protein PS903_03834 [Pseudomonas fluorescens]